MLEATAPPLASPRTRTVPAWPHLLSRAMDRLPVPAVVGYVAIGVVTMLGLGLRPWVGGRLPVGTIDSNSATFGVLLPTTLYFFRYLERSAGGAFERFRSALAGHADADAIRRDLAILPARAGFIALLAAAVLTAFRYAVDPASSEVDGLPGWVVAIVYVLEVANVGALFALVTQMVRQTLAIRHVLAEDTVVDIYRPGPLHALSGVSARMGIGLVLMTGTVTAIVVPARPSDGAVDVLSLLPFVVLPTVIALLTFFVPLYGTHGRLVDEKQRLEAAADVRLQSLVTEINQLIDTRRLAEVEPLNKALGAVIQQRDLVGRLSTWPWSSGTARALITAILLPIGLFVSQRVVAAVLGLH